MEDLAEIALHWTEAIAVDKSREFSLQKDEMITLEQNKQPRRKQRGISK